MRVMVVDARPEGLFDLRPLEIVQHLGPRDDHGDVEREVPLAQKPTEEVDGRRVGAHEPRLVPVDEITVELDILWSYLGRRDMQRPNNPDVLPALGVVSPLHRRMQLADLPVPAAFPHAPKHSEAGGINVLVEEEAGHLPCRSGRRSPARPARRGSARDHGHVVLAEDDLVDRRDPTPHLGVVCLLGPDPMSVEGVAIIQDVLVSVSRYRSPALARPLIKSLARPRRCLLHQAPRLPDAQRKPVVSDPEFHGCG